ncbi:SlyX family protein [Methylobrevis pamukkalensis]|uniref:Protein SlyX homolog n=1 Tax=Methylobrevis pamukkalensis TaxID=1439726 RepID=A0A1E3H898_9HYPH|nr:SlyX family protein [Methylobrevis pamukkalensis]ODN72558.1 lysis protein [Methylobrevis pamukkalensis]
MTTGTGDTARLDDLEAKVAYQDLAIEDLNRTITAQWAEIDTLKRLVSTLSERLAAAEQGAPGDGAPEPPPPHW